MSTSVPISGLGVLSQIRSVDFIPIVQSGSTPALTTYRASVQSINDYMAESGSVLTAFFASQSVNATHSILADSASYLFQNILYNATVTSSVSSSWARIAVSASNAQTSSWNLTSSYSRLSDSASYLYPTILYNATVTASVSASWAALARTASWAQNGLTTASFYPVTTSYSNTASFALNSNFPVGGVITWTPTVLNVTPPPAGWLYADGSTFSDVAYPNLAALIGHNYGRPITTSVEIKNETQNAYHSAHDGYLKVRFQGGGSGIFSFTSASVTFFVNNAGNVTFTQVNGGVNFNTTITDLGVNPTVGYPQSYAIPYAPGTSRTTSSVILGTPQFRVPNFMAGYFATNAVPLINPIAYIIKT